MRFLYLLHALFASLYRRAQELYYISGFLADGVGISINSKIRISKTGAQISLGKSCYIAHGTILIAESMGDSASNVLLKIGAGSAINEYCNIRAAGASIYIGSNTIIAEFVTLISSNYIIDKDIEPSSAGWDLSNSGIVVGDGVWIGANSVILPGVTIGDRAVIGAGAIVTKDVPAFAIAVGNPAKILRHY